MAKKMNMIESLGFDQINKQFANALFVREGKVWKLQGVVGEGVVTCTCLDDNKQVQIPNDFFTGFKVFAYPKLGYRRFGTHNIGYCLKVQSKMRGLSADRVKVLASPVTQRINAYGFGDVGERKFNKSVIIMQPKFDTPDKIKDLLDGKLTGVVLNESVIIEPSVRDVEGKFDVWYEQVLAGVLDDNGKYKWTTPKYERLVRPSLAA